MFQLDYLDPLRYLWRVFAADSSPRQVAVGIALGMMIGLVPKGNLVAVSLAFLLFGLRVNVGAGLLAAFLVSLWSPRIDQLTHGLGIRVLNVPWVFQHLAAWFDMPLVAWTSLNNTVVMGGLLLGAMLFYPVFHLSELLLSQVRALGSASSACFAGSLSEPPKERGMIRWRYVLPRLALVLLLVGGLWLGLNPLARWVLTRGGEAMIGARVELGDVQVNLFRTHVQLDQIRIADPHSPMKNLFQTDCMLLDLDPSAALRRKLVVREGSLTGIEFNTQRDTSGALERPPEDEEPASGSMLWKEAAARGEAWLETSADTLQQDLKNELQTVQLTREIVVRWPREYAQLETDAQQIERQRVSCATWSTRSKIAPWSISSKSSPPWLNWNNCGAIWCRRGANCSGCNSRFARTVVPSLGQKNTMCSTCGSGSRSRRWTARR